MTVPRPQTSVSRHPQYGLGWSAVAKAIAAAVPPNEIDGVWLFPPVRKEEREWGVAVVSCCAETERRRIFTGSYMMIVRGRERGQERITVEEVGEGPTAVIQEVIRGVQERAGETDSPVEISPDLWYGAEDDESAT
ncbi:MAG: hypothetical protein ACE5HT_08775 [Gemmatimonadales bacterium]